MKIITVSREFGSGGRELGKRLADLLQWDYYDSEIISAVAQKCGQNPQAVEQLLEHHGWQQFPVTYRGSIGSTAYLQSSQVDLLLKQKSVLEEIASLGKDCIIVGRNADVILNAYDPLNLFVCAQMDAAAGKGRPPEKIWAKKTFAKRFCKLIKCVPVPARSSQAPLRASQKPII